MLKGQKLKLKQWRVLKEFSREELAQRAELTPRTLYNYETDVSNLRKASYDTLSKIATALEISVDDIFLGDVSGNPKLQNCV